MVAIRPSTFIWFGILVLSSFSVGKGQSQGGEELEAATIGPFEKLSKNPVFLHFFFSPDGKLVAGSDSGLTLWNATDGKFVAKLEKRFFDTHWMAFSNSGRILATYNEEFGKVKNNRFEIGRAHV